jgi:trk system potassium uptake protein TrkH
MAIRSIFSLGKIGTGHLHARGERGFLDKLSPTSRILLGYLAAILLGALLLWSSPCQASREHPISFLDSLFTSTSAICVTGLTTIDVATQLSLTGQVVLLFLIQIGGLGIMALSAGLVISLGGRTSMVNRMAIAETYALKGEHAMRNLMRSVLIATIGIEFLGTLLLIVDFTWIHHMPFGQACWMATFHSISAFCNAGFSLFSKSLHGADSLMNFAQDPLLNFTIMGLIILGGIGFFVIYDLWERRHSPGRHRLSLQTKIAWTTSIVLILAGTLGLYLFEKDLLFLENNFHEAILPCLFQSVSARTAGFNSVEFSQLSSPSLLLIMIWMFIGGSPASCAGGIKTTTAFVLITLVIARFQHHRNPRAFDREINDETVVKSVTLALASLFFVGLMFFLLLAIESTSRTGITRGGKFLDLLFETVSAFGTVGLSVGVTPTLHSLSKLVLILCMFVGRVGMFSIFVTLSQHPRVDKVRSPKEALIVG